MSANISDHPAAFAPRTRSWRLRRDAADQSILRFCPRDIQRTHLVLVDSARSQRGEIRALVPPRWLRRNLLIYGWEASWSFGIKLIDMLLTALRLV